MTNFLYNITTTIGEAMGSIDATDEDDAEKKLHEQYEGIHTTSKSTRDKTEPIEEIVVKVTSLHLTKIED